jgi:hypothetical protein
MQKNIEEKYEKPEKQQFYHLEINEYFFNIINKCRIFLCIFLHLNLERQLILFSK